MAQAWFLTSRPAGLPERGNFELRAFDLRDLSPGEVRVRNLWMSVDPYMRGRMNDTDSYVAPFALNAPLEGAAIGRVTESRSPRLKPGDLVQHRYGWRDEAQGDASQFRPLQPNGVPVQRYLDTLGATGATAWFGLLDVGRAKAGETVFVSAAAGAVGSMVVQIAKQLGMRVVGSAGGSEKVALVRKLGADAAIDYKAPSSLQGKLAAVAPEGIDVYFDNVGGDHLDAALGLANTHARVAICGMIGMYNSDEPVAFRNLFRIIAARIRIEGFLLGDFAERLPEFYRVMEPWVREGRIQSEETVIDGLEQMPSAFIGLFSGTNSGKLLVHLR